MQKIRTPAEWEDLIESLAEEVNPDDTTISVCCGPGCTAAGSEELVTALEEELNKKESPHQVSVKKTGCQGFCEQGPLVVIKPRHIFCRQVKAEDAERLLQAAQKGAKVVSDLLFRDPDTGIEIVKEKDIPFYRYQHRLLFKDFPRIDYRKIADYLVIGGYGALKKALTEWSSQEVLEEVKASGLRGRGGGGFPTGLKWEACRDASSQHKYLICNADEGDPGCFQDRSLVEGNSHLVLEGMILGAYAVGARQGYIYIRYEYPQAVEHFQRALEQAYQYGLLGEDILGTGFSFDLAVKRGGGAFVCGESSALIASLEGKIGEPRDKYIRNTEKGLWGRPTVLNNVKTWASIPYIVQEGASRFAGIGTEKSPGTMVFSLTGKVKHTGLVEVPLGLSLKELIYDIGGGLSEGKELKAVQTGGPSGGCIPADKIDLPLDYEHLSEVGSMLGSGGMIVMDEDTCMVDVARYFLSFTQEESCGKCVPCREGGRRLLELLEKITSGEGREEHLELIKEISDAMRKGALCNLGKLAPNPVLTTLKYFTEEYRRHIFDQKCPAGVCRSLLRYEVSVELCTACGECFEVCPTGALMEGAGKMPWIEQEKCIRCGACWEVCSFKAIKLA